MEKALNIISSHIEKILSAEGFSRQEGENPKEVIFRGKDIAYSIIFEDSNNSFKFRSCGVNDSELDMEWKILSEWLFEPGVSTQKDAEMIALDFSEAITGIQKKQTVKTHKKKKELNKVVDLSFFINRLISFFPDLKEDFKYEKENYENFRYVYFVENKVIPKVNFLLKDSFQKDRIKKIKEEHKDIILLYYHKISYLKMLCDHCHYVFDLENKGLIYAYSPFGRNEMKQIFNMEDVSIIELPADIYCQFGMISPVIVKNNTFVRPFETLIHFKKGDVFDPTSLLMIVMMISALLLGDLGIGVIMILISVIFKGKMMPLLQRMAIPVTIGGIVTGSFFYRMTLYHPLFIIFNSVLTRMSLFVLINVFAYAMLMIWKDIQRKRHLTKEGYNGDFKAKFSEY